MELYSEAQNSVLGSMLISPEIIGEILTTLKPDDFQEGKSRELFLTIRNLFLDGETVDLVTTLSKLGATQDWRDFILQLVDVTPTAQNFREYVKIVRRESKLLAVRRIGAELASVRFLEDGQALVGQLNDLMVERTGVRSVSMPEALSNFYERIKTPRLFLTWGYEFLDEGLYAEAGDLIILGGRPSDGKTAIALSMAYHQAKTKRVGFFSLETKEDKLFDRLFGSVSKVENSRIKRRQLTEDDYAAMAIKAGEVKDRDLHLIRAAGMSVSDIQSYALARRFDVIYIDYLQLIAAEGKNRTEQVTNISLGLHTLAANKQITVVALSQLSREGDGGKGGQNGEKKKMSRPPRLSDLRESGQIEQDADIVMFIYREEPDKLRSRRILAVAKNKEGSLGSVPLLFNGETQTFRPDLPAPVGRSAWKSRKTYDLVPEEDPFQERIKE